MDLKTLRKSKGLTQEEASHYLNVPLRTYKRIESEPIYRSSIKYEFCLSSLSKVEKQAKVTKKNKLHKIAIAGIGYVGLSLGVLLASSKHDVTLVDVVKEKVDLVNQRKAPFKDELIEKYLPSIGDNLRATININAYKEADFVIIATPTDFDHKTNSFDTSSVEMVINSIKRLNNKCLIIIKSTVPIGFTKSINLKFTQIKAIFSPEFLREGNALYDNLYPSRIIIGSDFVDKKVAEFARILEDCALNGAKTIYMESNDAEATKLFSNAYLAMRVAYFNELDSYAYQNNLSTGNIIKGMGKDPRIGDYYNNPSFGYGGYCLPKDSAQLSSSFSGISNNNLIKAIVDSNQSRKDFIVDIAIKEAIKKTNKKSLNDITIGIYKLSMKSNSDNYRSSSSLDILNSLLRLGVKTIVYDETYPLSIPDFNEFISNSDLIIANRIDERIAKYQEKLLSRDLYSRD